MMNAVKIEEFMRLREAALQKMAKPAKQAPKVQEKVQSTKQMVKNPGESADYYKNKTFELRIKAGQDLPVRKMGNLIDVSA